MTCFLVTRPRRWRTLSATDTGGYVQGRMSMRGGGGSGEPAFLSGAGSGAGHCGTRACPNPWCILLQHVRGLRPETMRPQTASSGYMGSVGETGRSGGTKRRRIPSLFSQLGQPLERWSPRWLPLAPLADPSCPKGGTARIAQGKGSMTNRPPGPSPLPEGVPVPKGSQRHGPVFYTTLFTGHTVATTPAI